MRLSHSTARLQALKAIPPDKRRTKVVRSLVGSALFVGAWFLPHLLGFPQYVAYIVGGFGAFIVSQDLVATFFGFVPALIRDLVLAFRGESAPRPPA
jgi:hypothetical protein